MSARQRVCRLSVYHLHVKPLNSKNKQNLLNSNFTTPHLLNHIYHTFTTIFIRSAIKNTSDRYFLKRYHRLPFTLLTGASHHFSPPHTPHQLFTPLLLNFYILPWYIIFIWQTANIPRHNHFPHTLHKHSRRNRPSTSIIHVH